MSPAGAAGRPVIGVSAYEEEATWGQWQVRAAILPVSYLRSVERAGGLPVIIPVQAISPAEADDLLGRLDGLVLAGGPDVDPARYGAEPHPRTDTPRSDRDELEWTLASRPAARELPTLAICRGFQLVNVVRGGTLHQHLPDLVGHEGHSPERGRFGSHDVRVEPGSQLARLVGWESASVPTHHHQGVERLGEGLVATAWAEDGTVEAFEDRSVPFQIGVQWHPEAGEDPALFTGLIEAAGARSASRV